MSALSGEADEDQRLPERPLLAKSGLRRHPRCPKSGHRMAAEGMQFSWGWSGGTISANLELNWEMSVYLSASSRIMEMKIDSDLQMLRSQRKQVIAIFFTWHRPQKDR